MKPKEKKKRDREERIEAAEKYSQWEHTHKEMLVVTQQKGLTLTKSIQ